MVNGNIEYVRSNARRTVIIMTVRVSAVALGGHHPAQRQRLLAPVCTGHRPEPESLVSTLHIYTYLQIYLHLHSDVKKNVVVQ